MGHHLMKSPDGLPKELECVLNEVESAHNAIVDAASKWIQQANQDNKPSRGCCILRILRKDSNYKYNNAQKGSWGIEIKRSLVDISKCNDPLVEGRPQSFTEILDQLATIERMIDALKWIKKSHRQWTYVHQCNPTTSSKGKDLAVGDGKGIKDIKAIFEISDVSGNNGNANGKMKDDIDTLSKCPHYERYLVVSSSSWNWLENQKGTKPTFTLRFPNPPAGQKPDKTDIKTYIVEMT